MIFNKPTTLSKHAPRRTTKSADGSITIVDSYLTSSGLGIIQAENLTAPIQIGSDGIVDRSIEVTESSDYGMELVTVTWSKTPPEPTTGGGGGGEDESPIDIEISASVSEEPLTTHPAYKALLANLNNDDLAALSAFMGGQWTDETGARLDQKLASKVPASLMRKIMSGQTHYYAPRIQATITYNRGGGGNPVAGTIATGIDGLPSLQTGLRWLIMGSGRTKKDGKLVTSVTYMAGNWDSDIYP